MGNQIEFHDRSPVPDPKRSGPRREVDVEMTSMVDVTFLLLIFFMVTASFQWQKSIEVPSQQSDVGSQVDNSDLLNIKVQVDERGSFLVMTPHWELETPGKQQLISALNKAASECGAATRLSIHVHELARLGTLVDVLDAGASAGMAKISITQFEHL